MPVKALRRPLEDENERLRDQLSTALETLRAIRCGEVDALVVATGEGDRVFTLKSADQTYRLMVEHMTKGAATVAHDGMVLYCNPFLAALLDVPAASIVGASLSSFVDDAAAASLEALLQTALRGNCRAEVSFRRGAGSVSTQVSLFPLPLEDPPVLCMIVTDLTEQKRHEEERLHLERERVARSAAEEATRAAHLEIERRQRVEAALREAERERIELLEHEGLARQQAEDAGRLKDEFLATLSHELRSPLSAIVAWAHVLRRPGLDPAVASHAVEVIDRNARAQARVVTDLLDLSNVITGRFHLRPGVVNLPDVIQAAADSMRPAAEAKDIRLELAVDPAAGSVSGDASRLQQVVWNLLANAVKFTPDGGRVHVRLVDAGSSAELSVTDDGSGIDPEFLPHIFERGRQADSSSTRRHGGLGLGLAIVRHLVELHGGTVEARNREDRSGAVFVVRLPLQHGTATEADSGSAEPTTADSQETGADPAAALQNVSILVVDDDEDTLEAMAIGLEGYGARVATAASVADALVALARERPEVLVADVGVAGENGYVLLQKVRALPADEGGATPAIALFGYATKQDRVNAVWASFQMHLSKPVTPAELAVAVARLAAPQPSR